MLYLNDSADALCENNGAVGVLTWARGSGRAWVTYRVLALWGDGAALQVPKISEALSTGFVITLSTKPVIS